MTDYTPTDNIEDHFLHISIPYRWADPASPITLTESRARHTNQPPLVPLRLPKLKELQVFPNLASHIIGDGENNFWKLTAIMTSSSNHVAPATNCNGQPKKKLVLNAFVEMCMLTHQRITDLHVLHEK
jgi:hypothetical protein